MRTAYTFVALRYRHDIVSGEFLNLGLLLLTREGDVHWRVGGEPARFKAAFPDLDIVVFRRMCDSVREALKVTLDGLVAGPGGMTALEFAWRAIPAGEGILQWSHEMSGITDDVEQAFERNYDRFVGKYEGVSARG